jgi:flagellar protein FliS
MVQTGHYAYRQNAGNSVISNEQLLLKLYAGSLNFLRLARRGMEENNSRIKGENISKVLAIITELDCALDLDAGGEIAENLSALYQHITFKLIDANLKNNINTIDEVEHILISIKEGFEQAITSLREKKEITIPHHQIEEHKEGLRFAI